MSSAICFNLDQSKILSSGNGLIVTSALVASVNPLPKDKFLDCFKLKAFADDIFNVATMMISGLYRVENIVRKGENAGFQYFLLCPQCFQKLSVSESLKL